MPDMRLQDLAVGFLQRMLWNPIRAQVLLPGPIVRIPREHNGFQVLAAIRIGPIEPVYELVLMRPTWMSKFVSLFLETK